MLTATAACQPMPGPAGAAWPSAGPGTGYCGPYPACCPPAASAHSWLAGLVRHLNPHGSPSLIALEASMGLTLAVFAAVLLPARAQARRAARRRPGQGR